MKSEVERVLTSGEHFLKLKKNLFRLFLIEFIVLGCYTVNLARACASNSTCVYALYIAWVLKSIFVYIPAILIRFLPTVTYAQTRLYAMYATCICGAMNASISSYYALLSHDLSQRPAIQDQCFYLTSSANFLWTMSSLYYFSFDYCYAQVSQVIYSVICVGQIAVFAIYGDRYWESSVGDAVFVLGVNWLMCSQSLDRRLFLWDKCFHEETRERINANLELHKEVLTQENASTTALENYSLVINSSYAPMFAINTDEVVTTWNRGMASLTRNPDAIGLCLDDLAFTDDSRDIVRGVLTRVVVGDSTMEDFVLRIKYGNLNDVMRFRMTAVVQHNSYRDVIGIICSGHQIEDGKGGGDSGMIGEQR